MRRWLNPVSLAYGFALLAFAAWWVFHLGTWVLNVASIAFLPAIYICGRYALRSWGARRSVLDLTVALSMVIVVLQAVNGLLDIERPNVGQWTAALPWISIAADLPIACLWIMWLKPRWAVRLLGGPTNAWQADRERSLLQDDSLTGWDPETGTFSPEWLVRIKALDRYRDQDTAAYIDAFQAYYRDYRQLAADPVAWQAYVVEWDRVTGALQRSLGARPGWKPAATTPTIEAPAPAPGP